MEYIYKLNKVKRDPYTSYVGFFPLTADKTESSSYYTKNMFVNSKDLL